MTRKNILSIIAIIFGLTLIYSGFQIYLNNGVFDFFYNILLSLNNLIFLKGLEYIDLANKFFYIRFLPLPKLLGILLIINGCGILFFVIITFLKNKTTLINTFFQRKIISNDSLYKYILIFIFTISLVILFINFNGEIARINSFKQAEVASNISFYVNNGVTIEETLFNKNTDLKFFSYPFYQYSVVGLCKITGFSVTQSGRLINIFFFVVTFLLFLKIFNILEVKKSIILISMFLFAFSPLLLYYYRSVHPDPMAIFLSFLSLYYYLKYEKEIGSKVKNSLIIIISGIIATLIKSPIYLMIIVAIFFYRLQTQNLRGIFKKDFIIYAFIIASTVVFYKITADIINEGAAIKAAWMFATLNLRISITPYILLFTWYFIEVLTPILFIFFLIGIYYTLKSKEKNPEKIMFSSLLYGMIITILIFFNVFRAHDYYQLPFIIVVAYLTALPINIILEKFKTNKLAYAYSVFQFIMIVLISFSIFKMPINPDFNVVNSGKFIQNTIKKNDFVFYVYDKNIQNWDPTYLFHSQREGFNLSLKNLKKDNYILDLIDKYKKNYNNFFVFIPNEFLNDFNIKQVPIHITQYKKDSVGIIYKYK